MISECEWMSHIQYSLPLMIPMCAYYRRQFREQTYEGVGEKTTDDQTFNRPGGYDWQHRFTPNTISRAMTRGVRRLRRELDPEDGYDPSARSRHHGRYRKIHVNTRDGHRRYRHGHDRSDNYEHSENRNRHRHNGKPRRHRRRADVGPNTHVIRGGELETHLIRRLDRWANYHGGETSRF